MRLQNLQDEIAEAIITNQQQSDSIHPAARISIHHNNMMSALFRTMKNTYPLISKLVGDDFFRITASEYIKQYPSRSGNLNDYGAYFSDFIAEFQPLKDLIYLAEVAQFEWICHELAFAADHGNLDISALKHIHPDQYNQLHFILHPASFLMKCHYPILQIIDLCQGNIEGDLQLKDTGLNLLIHRQEYELKLTPLDQGDFCFLKQIQQGSSLQDALEKTLILDPEFNLEEKLPEWVQNSIIIDFYHDDI